MQALHYRHHGDGHYPAPTHGTGIWDKKDELIEDPLNTSTKEKAPYGAEDSCSGELWPVITRSAWAGYTARHEATTLPASGRRRYDGGDSAAEGGRNESATEGEASAGARQSHRLAPAPAIS